MINMEKAAFTPDAILSAVEDLMKSKNKGEATVGPIKNIDDVDEEKIRIEQEIGVKLPEIDATKVKDEANEGLTEQETDLLQYQSLYY